MSLPKDTITKQAVGEMGEQVHLSVLFLPFLPRLAKAWRSIEAGYVWKLTSPV